MANKKKGRLKEWNQRKKRVRHSDWLIRKGEHEDIRQEKQRSDQTNEDVSIDAWDSSGEENCEIEVDTETQCEETEKFKLSPVFLPTCLSSCHIDVVTSPPCNEAMTIVEEDERNNLINNVTVTENEMKNKSFRPKRRVRKNLFTLYKDIVDAKHSVTANCKAKEVDDVENDLLRISEFAENNENDLSTIVESDDETEAAKCIGCDRSSSPVFGSSLNNGPQVQDEELADYISDNDIPSPRIRIACAEPCVNTELADNILDNEIPSPRIHIDCTEPCVNEDELISSKDEIDINPLESPLKGYYKNSMQWLDTVNWKKKTPEKILEEYKKNLHDSNKKKKYIKGGYADRLRKLVLREESAIALWKYQLELATNKDHSTVLTVQIYNIHKECNLYIAECYKVSSDNVVSSNIVVDKSKKWQILFSNNTVKNLALTDGCIVRIHSPWQTLNSSSYQEEIILCTNFTEFVMRDVTYTFSPQIIDECPLEFVHHCSQHDNSPIQQNGHQAIDNIANPPSSNIQENKCPADRNMKSSTKNLFKILEEHNKSSNVFSFIASVQRIIRYYTEVSLEKRWNLLLMGECGTICELQLLSTNFIKKDNWRDLLQTGEGFLFLFENVRIIKRTNENRSPALFSLIRRIKELYSQKYKELSDKIQMTCYILGADEDIAQVHKVSDYQRIADSSTLICNIRTALQDSDNYCRNDILVKVVYRYKDELWVLDDSLFEIKNLMPDTSQHCQSIFTIYCTSSLLPCGFFGPGCILLVRNILITYTEILADKYTSIHCVTCTKNLSLTTSEEMRAEQVRSFLPVCVQDINVNSEAKQLVKLKGRILAARDSDAYVWPACDMCMSGSLAEADDDEKGHHFFCKTCDQPVLHPVLKMNLEILVETISLPKAQVKIKLKQEHIARLLPVSSIDKFSGCDITYILNKSFGPILCCVIDVWFEANTQIFLLQEC